MLLALTLLGCPEPPEPYPEIWVSWESGDNTVDQNSWSEVPLLSDLVYFENGRGLAIDVENRALVTVQLSTGQLERVVALSGTPHRMAWNPVAGVALVSQDEEGPPRILAVDPRTGTTQVIPLTLDGTSYPALDVAWSEDGTAAWVLGADPEGFLVNWVLELDLETRAVEAIYGLDSGYAGTTIRAADGDLYVGHERFDLDAVTDGDLTSIASYPKNVLDPHRLQLSKDGLGTLWPRDEILYERDRTSGDERVTYGPNITWGIHGPEQWVYNNGDDLVYTVGVDFDEHVVQQFDRATGEELASWVLPGPERSKSTFYDVQVLFMSPDDGRVYLYAHQDFTEPTGFIKWVDIPAQ